MKKNQTIVEYLNLKEFPFIITDKNGRCIYRETSSRYWEKREYDQNGNQVYFENSDGKIIDKRVDEEITGEIKMIEIDGKKYKLVEIKK